MNVSKNINEGHRQRLRERFLKSGLSSFSEHEIVELLLTLSIPRKDVKAISKNLLKEFGSLKGIFEADPQKLRKIKGIGMSTSLLFQLIISANDVYLYQKLEAQPALTSSKDVTKFWKNRLAGLTVEVVDVAYLDSNLHLVNGGLERLSTGIATSTAISFRKIVESAIRKRATHIILAHNHPSGSAFPSDVDECNTRRLKIMLQQLDVELIDHIIVSKNNTFSFRENGLL